MPALTESAGHRAVQYSNVPWLLLTSILALLSAIAFGLLAALYYTDAFHWLRDAGLDFQKLRPLHTTFAIAWIILAGMAAVFSCKLQGSEAKTPTVRRGINQTILSIVGLWAVAACGIVVSHSLSIFTGREYINFPLPIAILVLAGWYIYFRSLVRRGLFPTWSSPVYVWMWAAGALLFMFTFVESHSYLLPYFQEHPTRDLAVEWKTYGMLVGAVNLLVYGSLLYLSENLTGDRNYARSTLAFSFFFVGISSSFTNFAHHTYHIPQSEWVKLVSFATSMVELILLIKVLVDLFKLGALWKRFQEFPAVILLLSATTIWTAIHLIFALVLSIPPINSYLHGTMAILAHSMGAMIGIDSMAMLAVVLFLCGSGQGMGSIQKHRGDIWGVGLLNAGLLVFWIALLVQGLLSAKNYYLSAQVFQWKTFATWLPPILVCSGITMVIGIAALVTPQISSLARMIRYR